MHRKSLAERLSQLIMAYGLLQEVRGAQLHRFHDVQRRTDARDHDYRHLRIRLANLPQRVEAVFARHDEVEQNPRDARVAALHAGQGFIPIFGYFNAIAQALDGHFEIAPYL
jgi:hypothetical protein